MTAAKKKPAHQGEREREIRLIHVAKRDLKLDDDTYRAMLFAVANVKSSSDLDATGRKRVLDHMKARGFKVRPAVGRPPSSDESPQMKKVRALWLVLADAGVVVDRSEKALTAYIKRQAKVDNPRWLFGAEGSKVIEALKQWAKRENVEVD